MEDDDVMRRLVQVNDAMYAYVGRMVVEGGIDDALMIVTIMATSHHWCCAADALVSSHWQQVQGQCGEWLCNIINSKRLSMRYIITRTN